MSSEPKIQVEIPILVKVRVTPDFLLSFEKEVEEQLTPIDEALSQPSELTPEQVRALEKRAEQLRWRLKEAKNLKPGAIIPLESRTGLYQLEVGQDYRDLKAKEVILEDWQIQEIR